MPFLITQGLGEDGHLTASALATTSGMGDPGDPVIPPGYAFQVIEVESFYTYLEVSFTRPLIIGGAGENPASYVITTDDPAAAPVIVTNVTSIGGGKLRLDCDEQTIGATYTLHLPVIGIVSQDHYELNAPYQSDFVGLGVRIQVLLTRAYDARILEVYFSEPPVEQDALDVTNYSIAPTLSITGAEKVTDTTYRLFTSRQTELQNYTVTISNIRGRDHNAIL